MSNYSTRNIRNRNGKPTLFNRSSKCNQLKRLIKELDLLEGDVQRRYERAVGEHPCYAGTLSDVSNHVHLARTSLADALAQLS